LSSLLYREISAASSCNQTMPGASDSVLLTATSRRFGGRQSPPPTFVAYARMALRRMVPLVFILTSFVAWTPAPLACRHARQSGALSRVSPGQIKRPDSLFVGGHQAAGPNRLLGVFWFAGWLNMRLARRTRIIRTNCSSGGFTRPMRQIPPRPAPSWTTSQARRHPVANKAVGSFK